MPCSFLFLECSQIFFVSTPVGALGSAWTKCYCQYTKDTKTLRMSAYVQTLPKSVSIYFLCGLSCLLKCVVCMGSYMFLLNMLADQFLKPGKVLSKSDGTLVYMCVPNFVYVCNPTACNTLSAAVKLNIQT